MDNFEVIHMPVEKSGKLSTSIYDTSRTKSSIRLTGGVQVFKKVVVCG